MKIKLIKIPTLIFTYFLGSYLIINSIRLLQATLLNWKKKLARNELKNQRISFQNFCQLQSGKKGEESILIDWDLFWCEENGSFKKHLYDVDSIKSSLISITCKLVINGYSWYTRNICSNQNRYCLVHWGRKIILYHNCTNWSDGQTVIWKHITVWPSDQFV
jgi:hypothetical protein